MNRVDEHFGPERQASIEPSIESQTSDCSIPQTSEQRRCSYAIREIKLELGWDDSVVLRLRVRVEGR